MARFLSPEQQFKKDTIGSKRHQTEARRVFRAVLKELEPYWIQAQAAFPGSEPEQIQSRARAFVKLVKDLPNVRSFLDTYIGNSGDDRRADSWRSTTVYLWRDLYLGKRAILETLEKLDVLSAQGYQALTMTQAQKPVRDAIPPRLRAFLPDNIVVDVDSDGYIERVTDRFENERFNLEAKIDRLKLIISQYNEIVLQVKKDLRSSDEVTRLSALVTSIIMETGIRPGKIGNKKFKVENGEEIGVETFGAVTLEARHVVFIRENFAQLEFVGKATTINTAALTDSEIIKVLKDYVDRALEKGSEFIFVTLEGDRFDYVDLQTYFRNKFKGISPTDFRKLKATETVFNSLLEQKEDLYHRIREFVLEAEGDLREKVVAEVEATIERAIASAQKALSHEDSGVTKGSYINPQVLLQFLSNGRPAQSLREAILDGKTRLSFNPMTFVEAATAGMSVAASRRIGTTLRELLESLEREVKPESPARVASNWMNQRIRVS